MRNFIERDRSSQLREMIKNHITKHFKLTMSETMAISRTILNKFDKTTPIKEIKINDIMKDFIINNKYEDMFTIHNKTEFIEDGRIEKSGTNTPMVLIYVHYSDKHFSLRVFDNPILNEPNRYMYNERTTRCDIINNNDNMDLKEMKNITDNLIKNRVDGFFILINKYTVTFKNKSLFSRILRYINNEEVIEEYYTVTLNKLKFKENVRCEVYKEISLI